MNSTSLSPSPITSTIAFWCLVLGVVSIGFRQAWYQSRTRDVAFDKLWQLAINFALSFFVALVGLLLAALFRDTQLATDLQPHVWLLCGLLAATAIAWPASFLAILTPLGAARAEFIDWGMLPIFGLLIEWWLPSHVVVGGDVSKVDRNWPIVILAALVASLGAMSIAMSGQKDDADGSYWPPNVSRTQGVVVGVCLALASSFFGLLGFDILGRLTEAKVSSFVLLAVRIVPLPFVLFVCSFIRGNRDFRITKENLKLAFPFSLLMILPLLALIIAKAFVGTGEFSMWLVLIPVCAFAFSVKPFELRHVLKVPRAEWFGMALILVGFFVSEIFGTPAKKPSKQTTTLGSEVIPTGQETSTALKGTK
jgi:hypothetical protein